MHRDFYGPSRKPRYATRLHPVCDGERYLRVLARRAARGEQLVAPGDLARSVDLN